MQRYIKPKVTSKRCHISFFLTHSTLSDSMGFVFGNIAEAQSACTSGAGGISASGNSNNSCTSNCIPSGTTADLEGAVINSGVESASSTDTNGGAAT